MLGRRLSPIAILKSKVCERAERVFYVLDYLFLFAAAVHLSAQDGLEYKDDILGLNLKRSPVSGISQFY